MAELLVLLTVNHEVPGSNLTRGGIQMTVRCLIAQSFSLPPFCHLDMSKVMLKGI